ncbi:MAG: choice-of-anchor Q domain-containing protein, partial [Lentisphaeria bacterium]
AVSPLINRGSNDAATGSDILGKTRIWNNGVVDIGAYELQEAAAINIIYSINDILVNGNLDGHGFSFEDNRTISSDWSLAYYTTADFDVASKIEPSSISTATASGPYYVRAEYKDNNYVSANSTQFEILSNGNSVTINNGTPVLYQAGATVTGTIEPSAANKFIEKLTYTGLDGITETLGGSYSFTMPRENVTITSTEADITSVRYVSVDGSGDKNGYNWNHAAAGAAGLGTALADTTATEVWVAKGTYSSTTATNAFTIPSGVKVYGGFAGSETSINDRAITGEVPASGAKIFTNETILTKGSQANTRIVNMVAGTAGNLTILDGVSVTGGANAATGAGINTGNHIKISNCLIYGNKVSANYNSLDAYGGAGIYADGANITIENSVVKNNESTGTHGSAIYIRQGGGTAKISSCEIYKNTSARHGPVLIRGGAVIEDTKIYANTVTGTGGSNNSASRMSAIGFADGSSTMRNCLIYGNSIANVSGGAVCVASVTVVNIINCSIVKNTAGGSNGGGLFVVSGHEAKVKLTNTALFENSNAQIVNLPTDITNSAYVGATGDTNVDLTNVTATDLFKDAAAGDFSLVANSILINSGLNSGVSEFDLAGNVRIWNPEGKTDGVVDIGAYEYQGAADCEIVFNNLSDVPQGGGLPQISAEIKGGRKPGDWQIAFYPSEESTEAITPDTSVDIDTTYYVKATDISGHWQPTNIGTFKIVDKNTYVALKIKYENLAEYVSRYFTKDNKVQGALKASSDSKFIETLNYSGITKAPTIGGSYEFTMPESDVTITVNELDITPIRYVSVDGSGDKNGYSWNNATAGAAGLQAALADTTATEVWVARGT